MSETIGFQATGNGKRIPVSSAQPMPVYTAPAPAGTVGLSGRDYETVAASQTDQAMGATGAVGDYLQRLIITVNTALTAAVSIKDGAGSSIPIMPNLPGGGIGVYVVEVGAVSTSGAWKVTTGAGSTAVGVGSFT